MVGIVIATHGPLADAFLESAKLISGMTENIKTIGLYHGDDIDGYKNKLQNLIAQVDNGDGVIVFADIFGGSPCNSAIYSIKEMEDRDIQCIVGVNLPVLLEALSYREAGNTIIEIVKQVIDAAPYSIQNVREIIGI